MYGTYYLTWFERASYERIKKLYILLIRFCAQYSRYDLQLSQEEWQQIDYLLVITQPFFIFITTLLKTKDITVHTIFGIYNKLLKAVMLSALKQAKLKLSEYYSMTNNIHNDLYRHKISFTSFLLRSGSHAGVYDTARVLRITLCPTNSDIRTHSPYLMATLQ
ncbi:hypothetical protein GB937_010083 [Aspergillus fischeri]|nr:hypothetical protein GB937_010083 [Aspergillus fischeri]